MDAKQVAEEIGGFILSKVLEQKKTGGVMGLSGGVDSTCVAALAKRAFDRHNAKHPEHPLEVVGYLLPSNTNHPKDAEDGLKVAARLGIRHEILSIEAIVQNNPGALPYLSPGRNLITVSVADPKALGNNKLAVTYAYRLGARTKSFEQLCDEGKEIARQHNAKWSDTVTCARKVFAAGDLPATFEINCPTPKGQYPVYPRMVFLRREVLGPGSSPSPLPAGALEAKVGPGDELMSLPNPFLVGTETPPPIKARAVKTTHIPLKFLQYVNDQGEVAGTGTLRWPKNRAEEGKVVAGAVIVTGELVSLPAKGLAAARLVVPVTLGHNKAAGKLGVVFLKSPVEPGKACAVRELSDIAATTVIPKQPEDTPEYKPAKLFSIDITRAVKAVASGENKFNGLALRMVPDRGTDDGYTIRCDIPAAEEMHLEMDVYTE